jgi:hypothetical protein
MANPRKADIQDAAEIGGDVRPSTLAGWKERGYGPAEPVKRSEYIAHFQALQSLITTGRDGDVVTLQMANKGYPCRRLPDVLANFWELRPGETDSEDADDLIEYFKEAEHLDPLRASFESAVEDSIPLYDDVDPKETKQVMGDSALLPIAQITAGETVHPGNLVDYATVEDSINRKLGLPVDWASDDPVMLDISSWGLKQVVAVVRTARKWREEATPSDMVRGVRAAKTLLDGIEALGIVRFNGEEERWRWIGRATSTSEATLQLISNLVALGRTGLGEEFDQLPPGIRAYLASVSQPSQREVDPTDPM